MIEILLGQSVGLESVCDAQKSSNRLMIWTILEQAPSSKESPSSQKQIFASVYPANRAIVRRRRLAPNLARRLPVTTDQDWIPDH